MISKSRHPLRWAAAPLLAAGLVVGGAVAASATSTVAPAGVQTIAPGASGTLDAALVNQTGPTNTANVGFVWQAPANSTFANASPTIQTNTAGQGWVTNGAMSGCTLSNGNTSLTCPQQSVTVPAPINGAASYVRFLPTIDVSASAPYNSTFTNTVTFTSSNSAQVAPGSTNPGYRTPAAPPVPVIDPMVALGAGALVLGTGAVTLTHRRRKSANQI